jgi:hypothetical protein
MSEPSNNLALPQRRISFPLKTKTPSPKENPTSQRRMVLEVWSFSGAWSLVFGASKLLLRFRRHQLLLRNAFRRAGAFFAGAAHLFVGGRSALFLRRITLLLSLVREDRGADGECCDGQGQDDFFHFVYFLIFRFLGYQTGHRGKLFNYLFFF